jgi:hypothetical protein
MLGASPAVSLVDDKTPDLATKRAEATKRRLEQEIDRKTLLLIELRELFKDRKIVFVPPNGSDWSYLVLSKGAEWTDTSCM